MVRRHGTILRHVHINNFLSHLGPTGRGHRVKAISRMQESIAAQQLDDDGHPVVKHTSRQRRGKKKSKISTDVMDIDGDDSNFATESSDDETDEHSSGIISNGEVCHQRVLIFLI